MKNHYKYILVIIWMIIIFLFSNEPATLSHEHSGLIVHAVENLNVSLSDQVLTFLSRKAAHTFLYLILGVLIFNIVRDYRFNSKYFILVSVMVASAYACSDEFHQQFVSGRSSELRDVLIDTVASIIGVCICYFVVRRNQIAIRQKDKA